jgi:hypothetical protein
MISSGVVSASASGRAVLRQDDDYRWRVREGVDRNGLRRIDLTGKRAQSRP